MARSFVIEVAGSATQVQRMANRPMPNVEAYDSYIYYR